MPVGRQVARDHAAHIHRQHAPGERLGGELQQLGRTLADAHHARAGVVQAAHHRLARILEEGRHALDAAQRLEILMRQLGELGVHHLPREHGRAAEDVLHVADLLAPLHLIEVALDDLDRQAGGLGQPLRRGGALGLDLGRHVQHRLHRALRGLALAVEDLVIDVDGGRCRHGRLGLLLVEQGVVDVGHGDSGYCGRPAATHSSAMRCSVTGRPRLCRFEAMTARWLAGICATRTSWPPTLT